MKKLIFTVAIYLALGIGLKAQTLNIDCGNIIYTFPASETGVMPYQDATTLSVAGHTFNISEIKKVFVTQEDGENNIVKVVYAGEEADVYVSYDIIPYISANIEGAHVEITQSKDVSDDTCGEITYRLSGSSTNGSLTLNGSFKSSIELTGLSLSNPQGAAIDIENSKRIALRVAEGTENNLEDGEKGDQKAALYCKGHLEFKQKGILNITGNKGHAIAAKEYIEVKNTTINISGAVKDGINCTQYFLMESGNINISGVGEDGIQTDYKNADKPDDEDTGSINIEGGTAIIAITGVAAKGLKAEADFLMKDGKVTITNSGAGEWDSSKSKTKSASCISADRNIHITGGELNLTATGGGGKGISADGEFYSNGGDIAISTSGGVLAYVNGNLNQNYTGNTDFLDNDYKSSPKGIKINGDININGGTYNITCTGQGGEGIESKSVLTIENGEFIVRAYDDGMNSSSDMYLKGGNFDIMSIGDGDGVDSNSNIYVSGGRMMIFGARQPEQGFDAGDGYSVYFTGGEILAWGGGGNSVPSSGTDSTQPYIGLSQSLKAGENVTVSLNGQQLLEFTVPDDFNPQGRGFSAPPRDMTPMDPPRGISPFGAPPGGGWGPGNMGAQLVISSPSLIDGTTYDVTIGTSSLTATAKLSN